MYSRFQPFRLLTPFLILLVFCAVSYWLNPTSWRHLSLVSKGLFAGSALVVIALLLALRNRMYLRMDERGIEIQYIAGAPRFHAWSDIDSVRIFKVRLFMIPMTSSIHLRLKQGSTKSFPAFFEESAQEIVEKINFFKRQRA